MYARESTGFGGVWDDLRGLFDPFYGAAREAAQTQEAQQLSSQAAQQAVNIHAMLVKLQAAKAAGDMYAAGQWRIAYNTAVDAYNGLVRTLRELEGPGSTWLFLAKLPDLASAGLDKAIQDAIDKLKRAAKGLALYVVLPVVALALALIWVAGRSGAVQIRKVV